MTTASEKPFINGAKETAELRTTYIKTVWLVWTGYVLTQAATLAAVHLGLTGMSYGDIILPAAVSILGTSIFIAIITANRKPTVRFGNIMFLLQYPVYISMYALWVYRLQEIRLLGLFCALIAVTFVILFTSPLQSLLISLGTVIAQIAVSCYAIGGAGQGGDLRRELFFTLCMIPAFIFLSIIARHIKARTVELAAARRDLIAINRELEARNRELRGWQLITRNEMELARAIQQTMLPQEPPHETSGWDIAFTYRPRQSVSGDFYDFYYSGDELKGMSLFDVSGHGISSGLIMMMAKPLLYRIFTKNRKEPLNLVMDEVNREISLEIDGTHSYITGILLRFSDGGVEYINAGHPDLLVLKHGSGEVSIPGDGDDRHKGKPLGLGEITPPYDVMALVIERGDVLLLYSDCLLESAGAANSVYGMERIVESFRRVPEGTAQEMLSHMINDFDRFMGNETIADDLTLIVAKKI